MAHGRLYYNQIRSGGVQLKSGAYTVQDSDSWSTLWFTATATCTLPSTPFSGTFALKISANSSATVTLSCSTAMTTPIGTSTSITVSPGTGVSVWTDGTTWYVVSTGGGGASGVSSLNGLTGALTLYQGSNITISPNTPVAGDIEIAASGGGGGAGTVIGKVTTTVGQTSVTFSSIPNTYTDLILTCSAASTYAATLQQLSLEINGDTNTSHYAGNNYVIGDTAAYFGGSFYSGYSVGGIFFTNIPGSSAAAGSTTAATLRMPNYSGTVLHKMFRCDVVYDQGSSAPFLLLSAGEWLSTAAVTSLTINCSNAGSPLTPFVAGSEFMLVGI